MADLNYCKVVDPTAVPRILRWRTTTSIPEMRKLNNYFFQSKEDRPAVVSAESIPSSCADLDELNKVVSLLRSELFQVKREKDVLALKVIRMEKLLDHYLGLQFEQEVRRDLALLKERRNRCVISHLFKGSEEMDDIQWDEGPSNRDEGEEKEDEGIEGGEGPSNRNEGEEKEEEGIEEGEVQGKPSEVEEAQRKRSEGEQVKIKSNKGEEAQRKSNEGEEVKRKSSKGEELQRKSSEAEDPQRKRREGKEVKRQRSEETEVQRNQCEKENNEVMLLGDDIGESTEGTKVEFTLVDIDLDQPTAVLSQLNVWLNDKGKAVEQGVQLRKRKKIIPMWKIIEGSELVQKTLPETTRLQMLDPMKAIPHDDMVKLLNFVGNGAITQIKADGWLKGDVSLIDYAFVLMYIYYEIDKKNMLQHIDLGLYLIRKRQQELEEVEISDWTMTDVFFMNHIHTCFADNKRKKEQVGWKIRNSLLNVVNGKVPACRMDWQNAYKVYAPCMLMKYKHWLAVMIDLVLCEIKVYDSKVLLIPDEILKEELAPLSITIPNLLNTVDFYEEERVDVPQ
ncbi:hypothetical protein L3X38_010970 [Prunus dulcis]|uniref:Ubiquitin-like protease family profile domain-containing protein n=1 Tax=Prunus dulcis TaxID=3755 RepID=A0AAD4WGW3_PRUDU|nr:hypothetical protein L3X38_010970 [Prunus dulcis]